MELDVAQFARVTCEIYDAAINPQLWPKALEACCAFLDAFRANLFCHDMVAAESSAVYEFNEDASFTKLYLEKYVALNPMFPAAAFMKPGQVVAATDLVPQDELETTRFFQEWVKPQGIVTTFGAMLENEALRGAFVSFHWNEEVADADARAHLALLVPHLQRAVAIGRLFAQTKRAEVALSATLDRLDSPVLLLGPHGRVVFANASAQALIARGDLLGVARDLLSAVDAAADRQLKQALVEIEKSAGVAGATVTLSDARDHRWIANVLPLVDGARERAGKENNAIAAVFVRNAVFSAPAPLETLAARYRLTASEVRVLDAIVRMSGIDAVAGTLGIARATVKTHLNRIFRKTAARNQSDLVKLIAGYGPPA